MADIYTKPDTTIRSTVEQLLPGCSQNFPLSSFGYLRFLVRGRIKKAHPLRRYKVRKATLLGTPAPDTEILTPATGISRFAETVVTVTRSPDQLPC